MFGGSALTDDVAHGELTDRGFDLIDRATRNVPAEDLPKLSDEVLSHCLDSH